MPREIDDKPFMTEAQKEVRKYLRPSENGDRELLGGWKHTPDVEVLPAWVLPVLVLIALALFIVLMHLQQLEAIIH